MTRRTARPVDTLLDRLPRLNLVVGKGGVGKTTAAAALALRAAERGERAIVLSTDPAGTLGAVLESTLDGDVSRLVVPGAAVELDALQLDPRRERAAFLAEHRETIVSIIDRGTYLDLEDITGLVDAALPGADEIFGVLRLGAVAGADAYERIIVDTAPTGHTLRLLDLPRSFAALVAVLDAMQAKHRFMVRSLTRTYRADAADAFLDALRRQIADIADTLRDRSRTRALLITRNEPIVLAESVRYATQLRDAGIAIGAVIANATHASDARNATQSVAPHAMHWVVPPLEPSPIGRAGLGRWTTSMQPIESSRGTVGAHGRRQSRGARSTATATERAMTRRAPAALVATSLTIVGGKGGVGKTTAACALAVAVARPDRTVLLVSTDPAPSIADALAHAVGDDEIAIASVDGLFARQMDADAAFRHFRLQYESRIDAVFDAFVQRGFDASHDRAIMRDLLALAPPGIDEIHALAALGETVGEDRYGHVIVDPAPTGHLLRLLEMPAIALDWSHRLMRLMLKYREVAGLGDTAQELLAFARRTRRVDELLRDPSAAGLVVVALDEPVVRDETLRLIAAVRERRVAVRGVVWNRSSAASRPDPLPVVPPVAQFVAPAAEPPPIGIAALRAWAANWREMAAP